MTAEDRKKMTEKTKNRKRSEGEKRRIGEIQRSKEKRTSGGKNNSKKKPSPYSPDTSHMGREDWGPCQAREDRLGKECEKQDTSPIQKMTGT